MDLRVLRRWRDVLSGMGLLLAAIVTAAPVPSQLHPDGRAVWFQDLSLSAPVSESGLEALARLSAAAVLRRQNPRLELSDELLKDIRPRLVFLSVSDGRSEAYVALGSGFGMLAALRHAIASIEGAFPAGYEPQWIKVDFVQQVVPRQGRPDRPLELDPSLFGFAVAGNSELALLPDELMAQSLLNRAGVLRPERIARYLDEQPVRKPLRLDWTDGSEQTLYGFATRSVFADADDVTPLYRGHRGSFELSQEALLSAARNGGRYLVDSVRPNGRFVYEYEPRTDSEENSYNILRHAGTIYSMLELYEATFDPALLTAARRATDYLSRSIRSCPGAGGHPCVVEDGYIKLGGNALTIVALAKYTTLTADPTYVPTIQGLARWIRGSQAADGSFSIHKQDHRTGELSDFVSVYYPGEAVLALARAYDLDHDEDWLDGAEAAARYLIEIRDAGLTESQLPHDHWLLYALNELYRERANPIYLEHAMRLARAIVRSQNRQPAHPDWLGSYYRPPRSTPTATRTEGLSAAYALARDFDRPERNEILEAIRLGAVFQLQTQFRPESAMYLPDPQRSLGGFHESLTSFGIRIDYVQHNISSLLATARILGDADLGDAD